MKIFIDPGHNHSKFNTGATGNGLKEQDITFKVAEKLSKKFKNVGIEVMMSRNAITDNVGTSNNTSLTQRVSMANKFKADYVISLHCDAHTNTSASGSHICIYKTGGQAEKLAESINPHLLSLGLKGRNKLVVERPELAILKSTTMPAVLIEMGFITNKRDSDIQKNNQDGLAEAVFKGTCDFLGISYSKETNSSSSNLAKTETKIKINGKSVELDSVNINDSIYVPIRKFCELIGYNVGWDGSANEVIISNKTSLGNENTTVSVQPAIAETKYSIIGTTHVIEIDPRNVSHVETQTATNKTSYDNFVNSLFFMAQANGIMFPQGMAVNDGKVLSNYATHGKPVATLVCYDWNNVQLKYITDITKEKNVKFAVSGYGVYPNITASEEGFAGKFSDVIRSTNRAIIGYRKSDNKIVVAVRADSDASRANLTAKNLKLDFAISLDGGGSTTLKVNGKYKFKGDGRKLWGGITWK